MSDPRTHKSLSASSNGRFPHLKSLMAERLRATGVPRKRIYQLTRLIESEFFRIYKESLGGPQRASTVDAATFPEHKDANAGVRLSGFWLDKELDQPLILLIGGVTGAGKSTIATEVSRRLGIPRVIRTDFIRQRMRAFFSPEIMPSIHCSSFEAGSAMTLSEDESSDPTLRGFLDQTRNVLMGVRAVLARSLEEGRSMAVEGVHIVPGWIPTSIRGAIVVPCLLAAEKVEAHVSNFWIRSAASRADRPARRYLRSLSEIRRIQDYLIEQARKLGVPVIETSHMEMEEAIQSLIRLVLNRVEQRTLPRDRRQSSSLRGGLRQESGRAARGDSAGRADWGAVYSIKTGR